MTSEYDHWPVHIVRPEQKRRKLKRDTIVSGNEMLTAQSMVGSVPLLGGYDRCRFMFKTQEDPTNDLDFVPFYDESYAALIPEFSLNEDNAVTPEYVDHEMFSEFLPRDEQEVYYLICPVTGLIKIGYTSNIVQRVTEHRTGSAISPYYLSSHPANEKYEKYVHQLFEPLRHHGEWFWPHPDLCGWVFTVSLIFGGNTNLISKLDAR